MRLSAMRYGAGLALAAVLAAALTAAVRAPAAWVGTWLQEQGRGRWINARGTAWSGSGMFGLSDGAR